MGYLTSLVAAHESISCVVLDKTADSVAAQWKRELLPEGCDRVRITPSPRESNFFVDTVHTDVPRSSFVVTVHDDDDVAGLESLLPLLDPTSSTVLLPRLIKVGPGGEQLERVDDVVYGATRTDRLRGFMAGARPQSFLFSAVSPTVWSGWSRYVGARPMPSLSLDFTFALFAILTATPVYAPEYTYRFNMHNWLDTRTAEASTSHWLERDGWQVLRARDVWLIRLLDDLSLLGYLAEGIPVKELRQITGIVGRGQDGLTGGRARLAWASPLLPPSIRWPLATLQSEPPSRMIARRPGNVAGGRWGFGRSRPSVDPRAGRLLPSLLHAVLPNLARLTTGTERDQVDYWRTWIEVLDSSNRLAP